MTGTTVGAVARATVPLRVPNREGLQTLPLAPIVASSAALPHLCAMTEGPDRSGAGEHMTSHREPRQSVFLSTTLERFGSGGTTKHRVRDLSPGGMRIDLAESLQAGATVLVAVGQLEAIGATIVWVKEGSAGIKFAKAIDPDKARGKAAVRRTADIVPNQQKQRGPTAGWVVALNNPYQK